MIFFMIHTAKRKNYGSSIKTWFMLDIFDIIMYTDCECIKRGKEVIDEKNIKHDNGNGDDILPYAVRQVVCG